MVIHNQKWINRYRLRMLFFTLLSAAIIVTLFLSGWFEKKTYSNEIQGVGYFVIGIWLLVAGTNYYRNIHYLFISDKNENLTFRYFSIRPFSSGKKVIVINKQDLVKYEISETLKGLKARLVLSVNTKKGTLNYPPVSLSGYSKQHRLALRKMLDRYAGN